MKNTGYDLTERERCIGLFFIQPTVQNPKDIHTRPTSHLHISQAATSDSLVFLLDKCRKQLIIFFSFLLITIVITMSSATTPLNAQ